MMIVIGQLQDFVPLIAWFYLSIIIIISIGTFLTSLILLIHGRRTHGKLPPLWIRYWFLVRIPHCLYVGYPPSLIKIWQENDNDPVTIRHRTMLIKQKVSLMHF